MDGSRDGLCLRMVRQKSNAKTIAGAHLNVDGSRHVLAGARVLDEEEHAFLCAKMARELGHETGFAEPEGTHASASPSWTDRPAARERVLLDVVSMCCITESFTASRLRTL